MGEHDLIIMSGDLNVDAREANKEKGIFKTLIEK
jgi:hypothetical protein